MTVVTNQCFAKHVNTTNYRRKTVAMSSDVEEKANENFSVSKSFYFYLTLRYIIFILYLETGST